MFILFLAREKSDPLFSAKKSPWVFQQLGTPGAKGGGLWLVPGNLSGCFGGEQATRHGAVCVAGQSLYQHSRLGQVEHMRKNILLKKTNLLKFNILLSYSYQRKFRNLTSDYTESCC